VLADCPHRGFDARAHRGWIAQQLATAGDHHRQGVLVCGGKFTDVPCYIFGGYQARGELREPSGVKRIALGPAAGAVDLATSGLFEETTNDPRDRVCWRRVKHHQKCEKVIDRPTFPHPGSVQGGWNSP
jgi:hypothetical protein